MALPNRTQLGASTTNRKWGLDVQDPAAPGVWVPAMGLQESKPRPGEPTTQDDSDMDGGGFKSQTVTALTWGFDGKFLRKVQGAVATAYDAGQEIIRKAALNLGTAAVIKFRYYEMEPGGPRVEAYEGTGVPTWTPDGGNMESLDTVAFSITGRGARNAIAHPDSTAVKAAIASVLPSGAAAGATVAIEGSGFTGITGVTGVKFGTVNATSYNVLSDGTILAVVPAGAAGAVQVTVGTGAQLSDPVIYTRGA